MGVKLLVFILAAFPDGPGKETFESVCSLCHEPSHVVGKAFTRPEWKAKVLEMLQEEPDVTEAERETIVAYLAKNFPRKVNVNKASAKEIAAVLEVSEKEAEAIVEHRTYKSFDDMGKVLDLSKIDKIRIEF